MAAQQENGTPAREQITSNKPEARTAALATFRTLARISLLHLGVVSADYSHGRMACDAIDSRDFAVDDLDVVVAFSLRAWEPVFASVQAILGDEIFLRLHPDWRTSQAESVRSICVPAQTV